MELINKTAIDFIVYFLISLLVGACASSVQTIDTTRIVQQTMIATRYVTSSSIPYPTPSPYKAYPTITTPTPIWTATFTETPFPKFTQISPTLTDQQVSDKIAACYPALPGCSACEPKLKNNSIVYVRPTSRMFINAPKNLYPKELFQYATTISGQATMGWISNGGLPGYAIDGSPECWSTYVEFDGEGEIDLSIPSFLIGVPDYTIHFSVYWNGTPVK